MLENLTTEAGNPASANIDSLSALEIVHLMNSEDARVSQAVLGQAGQIAQAIESIAERLGRGGRLIYLGAGTSGRLGVLDAAECPPTFNSPPGMVIGMIAGGTEALTRAVEGAEDHAEFGAADLEAVSVSERDVVVGIASSGRTPYVIGGLLHARHRGALTIGFSCNADPELASACDLTINPVVGPEVISGSTRLKAGTATKLTLNMLTTGAMVLLGKTFGNLMVDLRVTNNKLLDRTRRIVMSLTGLTAADAEALLTRCDGELKTAIVAERRGIAPEQARQSLQQAGGHLRQALGQESTSSPSQFPPPGVGEGQGGGANVESTSHPHPGLPPSRGKEVLVVPAAQKSRRYQGQEGEGTRLVASESDVKEPLVLGIDGGGSKTTAWLAQRLGADDWQTVGRGGGGPSNPQAVGFPEAFRTLEAAIADAFQDAGIPPRPVQSACVALAGADRESDRARLKVWAQERQLAREIELVHDALPLLAGGTPAGWGVAVIAGTGSIVFGRSEAGESTRAGGWGYLLGDEGSAYIIALQGLQAAARAADQRGGATGLLPRFLEKFQLRRPLDLIGAVYQGNVDRPTIASWSDVVFDEAAAGDAVAVDIITRGAAELADTIAVVCSQLAFERIPFPLALSGGLLIHQAAYRDRVVSLLEQRQLTPGPVGLVAEPVAGAVILAQRRLALMSMNPASAR